MIRSLIGVAIMACCVADLRTQERPHEVFARILDGEGRPVPRVLPADIRMLEDGTEATILRVEPINWPIRVAVLIDNGIIMADSLMVLRSGLKAFVRSLPPGVEVSLQTIAPQPRWLVRPTDDRQALSDGIDRLTLDSAGSRFIEGLREIAEHFAQDTRVERETFPVVVMVGTTGPEISDFNDRDLAVMVEHYRLRAVTVHVVLLNVAAAARGRTIGSSGAYQTEVGLFLTKMTGGRYEAITAASRIATLLPEIGEQMANSHARQSTQHRITFQRPPEKTGRLGGIVLHVLPPGWGALISRDGRMP